MYGDGLVADTRHSTEAGDSFLSDLVTFAASEFRLSADPLASVKKVYLSELEVTTNVVLDVLNEKARKFSRLLADTTKRDYHEFGFKVATDPATPGVAVMFTFERKVGSPFTQNRYWSQAPLSTKHHQELLDRLEQIMAE
jgi:hypothetical protein